MNQLQILTTLLESIGLFTIYIDLRFPRFNHRAEKFVDALEHELIKFAKAHAKEIWYQASLTFMIGSVLIVGVGWLFGEEWNLFWWIIFWISSISGTSLIFVVLIGDFINLCNRISVTDQALTSFGFFLALLGLILELLQLFGILS